MLLILLFETDCSAKSCGVTMPNLSQSVKEKEQGHPSWQRQFLENICSEDDLRSGIFGTFVVKFLAFLPLLGFSTPPPAQKKMPIFNGFLP